MQRCSCCISLASATRSALPGLRQPNQGIDTTRHVYIRPSLGKKNPGKDLKKEVENSRSCSNILLGDIASRYELYCSPCVGSSLCPFIIVIFPSNRQSSLYSRVCVQCSAIAQVWNYILIDRTAPVGRIGSRGNLKLPSSKTRWNIIHLRVLCLSICATLSASFGTSAFKECVYAVPSVTKS